MTNFSEVKSNKSSSSRWDSHQLYPDPYGFEIPSRSVRDNRYHRSERDLYDLEEELSRSRISGTEPVVGARQIPGVGTYRLPEEVRVSRFDEECSKWNQ